ncbi:MAG: AGE family epimerase/isomerase [Kouleothrix sp.]|jgi:N-acylglucosamine 2-epimerase|nr:AGE family epimerase/isomerase [Kouleothrix sp.]
MLQAYAARYRRDLTESVIPFWLKHSLDREHGGYFTCLDRDGSIYDTKKYVWLQGRAVWMFARLYNQFERRPEFLDAARLGIEFLRRHARDPQGRVYFSLTRAGAPFFFQRKPYAAVFYQMGLLEYAKASGDQACLDEAAALFWQIVAWIADPALLDRPAHAGQVPTSSLANQLVLGILAAELAEVFDDERYRQAMRDTIAGALRHYDPQRRIFRETIALDGRDLGDWPEGRLFSPGHSIETAWILLHLLRSFPDAARQQQALDAIEGSLERGWDSQCGGLYYFMDLDGRPTLQLEATMKLWWPHAEAIYALVLAHTLTGDARWLGWLEQVDRYTYAHFVDQQHGEWFGYCDRRGELALTSKGGNYKGFFHVPRALLFSIQAIEAS